MKKMVKYDVFIYNKKNNRDEERILKERSLLDEHYNKHNEEKRLSRRHGQVEYLTTMRYVHKCIDNLLRERQNQKCHSGVQTNLNIIDIGAGTGRYSVALDKEGYDVTAVELVKYNVGILKSKNSNVKVFQRSALNLKGFEDNQFDITLLFGPMYHLFSREDKVKALLEAKRVTKKNGIILAAYLMNEYGVLVHGFRDDFIKKSIENNKVDEEFHILNSMEDLYNYVRLEDIDSYNEEAELQRIQIIAATGPANYMRPVLNQMDEETFDIFMQYHYTTCERMDLIGASSHTLDILRK